MERARPRQPVAVEDLWVPPLLAGKTMADVGDSFDGDQLGPDPLQGWDSAFAAAQSAASEPGVDERTVHLSYGDEVASEYFMQIFTDHLVHAWDVAEATRGDTALPADLVEACASWFDDREALYRQMGVIGPRVDVPADASPQTRLLAHFGRTTRDHQR